MVTFCGQAVNAHGEGPLSDIVVGQTTESGEESQNKICTIRVLRFNQKDVSD